jgi:AsmA protein
MEGLNFQQLVQQAVERSSDVKAQENYDSATRLDSFTTDLTLDNGQLSGRNAGSSLLSLTGEGRWIW